MKSKTNASSKKTVGQKMTLVDGEKILINMEQGTCRPHNILVRAGKNIVVGIYYDAKLEHSAVFVWFNVKGVYQYFGDVSLTDNGNGSITWHVYPHIGPPVPTRTALQKKALELYREQILEYAELFGRARTLGVSHPLSGTNFKFLAVSR